ncbi:MAG: hypothetical protein M3362_01145 [Acidobacteriota bacterium]|nr:hypothetical protein [Acidobacteriota bacterium]
MGDRTKKDYMQDGAFAELMEAAKQALAYERGAREGYTIIQVEGSKSPRKIAAGETVSTEGQPESRRKHKNTTHK